MRRENIKLNIKELRKRKGVTQEQLAKAILSDKPNISKYERGAVTPPIDVLIDIANYFGCGVDDLLHSKIYLGKDQVVLDSDVFRKYYDISLNSDDAYNFRLDNPIYVTNIDRRYAVVDLMEDSPFIEFLDKNSDYDKHSLSQTINLDFDRKLANSEFTTSESILTIEELLRLAYSLGVNYDYFRSPRSTGIEITNEFLALCKLSTVVGNEQNILRYNQLIPSMFNAPSQVCFTEKGYKKHRDALNRIFQEKYQEDFYVDEINSPQDETHFLSYIQECLDYFPKTSEELYTNFNELGRDIYYLIGKSFKQVVNRRIFSKLPIDKFNLKVDYSKDYSKVMINGNRLMHTYHVLNDTEICTYVNFLIAEMFTAKEIADIWYDEFEKYMKTLGIELENDDIYETAMIKNKDTFEKSINNKLVTYSDYVKTRWSLEGEMTLDSSMIKLIKNIFNKVAL